MICFHQPNKSLSLVFISTESKLSLKIPRAFMNFCLGLVASNFNVKKLQIRELKLVLLVPLTWEKHLSGEFLLFVKLEDTQKPHKPSPEN